MSSENIDEGRGRTGESLRVQLELFRNLSNERSLSRSRGAGDEDTRRYRMTVNTLIGSHKEGKTNQQSLTS